MVIFFIKLVIILRIAVIQLLKFLLNVKTPMIIHHWDFNKHDRNSIPSQNKKPKQNLIADFPSFVVTKQIKIWFSDNLFICNLNYL